MLLRSVRVSVVGDVADADVGQEIRGIGVVRRCKAAVRTRSPPSGPRMMSFRPRSGTCSATTGGRFDCATDDSSDAVLGKGWVVTSRQPGRTGSPGRR